MIFLESDSDNGYRKTDLREGDAVVLFTDVNRVVFWRGGRYLFWSSLSELPSPLYPATDIKLYYDFGGGIEEFREKASSFATKYGFDLRRKEMQLQFGNNNLGKEIPCVAFKFIIIEGGDRKWG
jgi:hypothetical protein